MTLPGGILELGSDAPVTEIGTKAYNLSLLRRLGFRVPPCVFVTTFEQARLQLSSPDDYLKVIGRFSARLTQTLPSSDGWSVRSSATIEDLAEESHAGRFETVFIDSPDELADAVKAVWDSAHRASIGAESMGVVVQELIRADYAGVAFSTDPTSADNTAIVEGVAGMGQALVDGTRTPWRVRINCPTEKLPEGIDTTFLAELDAGLEKLAAEFAAPVDIEWALKDGVLYWLQVRPMTGTSFSLFEVPAEQKDDLPGLWVRINHSLSPQMPLVATLNPGGYFDGIDWDSRLVNGFHYLQKRVQAKPSLPESEFDKLLCAWDDTEKLFTRRFSDLAANDLTSLDVSEFWPELEARIKASQEYFRCYSDPLFLYVREQTEKKIKRYLNERCEGDIEVATTLGRLLQQLGSKTEKKQQQLRKLASLYNDDAPDDLRETHEWHTFIDTFGFESATTQLFYLPALEETPDLILAMIRQVAHAPRTTRNTSDWRSIARELTAGEPDAAREAFLQTLDRLRRCMLRTEDDDYLLGQGTKLVRRCFLEAGDRLVKAGRIPSRDDVFYLTGDELRCELFDQYSSGTMLEQRRKTFAMNRLLSPPPMIMNGRAMTPKAAADNGQLSGTPASPGVACGTVIVLDDPFSFMGKQLPSNAVVVAPVITPPLAYALMGCAAIVTETGGLASHGAIVAREMRIPAIVGVNTALSRLSTGMHVTVDGSSGQIIVDSSR